jgi:hypothetical protein
MQAQFLIARDGVNVPSMAIIAGKLLLHFSAYRPSMAIAGKLLLHFSAYRPSMAIKKTGQRIAPARQNGERVGEFVRVRFGLLASRHPLRCAIPGDCAIPDMQPSLTCSHPGLASSLA